MMHPIPDAALDDRLAFVGTSGTGKTYAAKGRVERLLAQRHRAVIVDALDVWWGLRLHADGKRSGFDVAIIGGKHGDLPINEHSGAVIGEAVASSSESCIVSLGSMKHQAARHRFMLAFLDAIYEHTDPDRGEPYHFIVDEADLWAPQKPMGNEAMLCHLMEEIVRRGRVKGFIPWVITQRPAVLNKNVLSQADGLIAMSLTSSQDRDAIGAWIEGQADRAQGKELLAKLPTLERGQGLVWIPRRRILDTVEFPSNSTFDSSRTPKRGEAKVSAELKPLNISALKERLATVEIDAKANDPKALRAEVARLNKALADAHKNAGSAHNNDEASIQEAYLRGVRNGDAVGRGEGYRKGFEEGHEAATEVGDAALKTISDAMTTALREARNALFSQSHAAAIMVVPNAPIAQRIEQRTPKPQAAGSRPAGRATSPMSAAERAFLTVLAQRGTGLPRNKIAIFAGYSVQSGHVDTTLSKLRTKQWAEGGGDGVRITAAGLDALGSFEALPTGAELQQYWLNKLNKAQQAFLKELIKAYPYALTRAEIANACGYSPDSGHVDTTLSSLRSLSLAEGPGSGVRASPDLFDTKERVA